MKKLNRRTEVKTMKRRDLLKRFFNGHSAYPSTSYEISLFASNYTTPELNSMLNGFGIPSDCCATFSKTEKADMLLLDKSALYLLEGRHEFERADLAIMRREFRRDLSEIGARDSLYSFLTSEASLRLQLVAANGEIKSVALDPEHPELSDPERWLKLGNPPLDPVPVIVDAPDAPTAIKEVKIPEGTDPMTSMIAAAIVPIVRDALRSEDDALTEKKVLDMISTEIRTRMPHMIQPATPPSEEPLPAEIAHEAFPQILKAVQCNLNAMLIGPAGSGKTTVAEQIAKALRIPFRFTGAVDSPYKLTGFMDANGKVVRTAFRETYENGGLFLFDEVDASSAGAMMAFNAALANGRSDFPDGVIERHKDFRCIAASNTFGRGADRIYVGRNALDGATLDRFVVVDFDYDEALEAALTGEDMVDWVHRVQAIRKAIFKLKLRFVVSPRASIFGSRLLRAGMPKKMVEEMVVWKGMEKEARAKINAEIV
mgnify:CR=1 FL=1